MTVPGPVPSHVCSYDGALCSYYKEEGCVGASESGNTASTLTGALLYKGKHVRLDGCAQSGWPGRPRVMLTSPWNREVGAGRRACASASHSSYFRESTFDFESQKQSLEQERAGSSLHCQWSLPGERWGPGAAQAPLAGSIRALEPRLLTWLLSVAKTRKCSLGHGQGCQRLQDQKPQAWKGHCTPSPSGTHRWIVPSSSFSS